VLKDSIAECLVRDADLRAQMQYPCAQCDAYVPIDWLEREFPAFRESASLLRGKNLRGLSR
jgi:hypothetical protein